MSEEHPLRDGDTIVLAEDIQLRVQLVTSGPLPTPQTTSTSRLRSKKSTSYEFLNFLIIFDFF